MSNTKLCDESGMDLESAFKEFLEVAMGAVNLDALPESHFPKHKSDYYLEDRKSIFEIKTISSDRADAFQPWLQKRVENSSEVKNGMPVVFGTVSFKRLYEGHSNKELFHRQLDSLAARTLADYVRSSKKQIHATKKALDCKDAYGFLVILNEKFQFYETWFVYRMVQMHLREVASETPHLKIDGVWYINESAKSERGVEVVFIHDSEELEELEELEDISANEILDHLALEWAKYREYIFT